MTDASAGISDEERRKRSVYYQACTSPVKDDIPTLVKCLRTDQGPHNRQEAGFLLWHHALDGDSVSELVGGGVISACVSLLEVPTVPCTDKACCAGTLLALVAADEQQGGAGDVAEAVVRCRAQTGAACLDVLHGLLLARDNDLARSYSAKLLAALAKAAGPAVMKSLVVEGALPYLPTYLAVWAGEQRDAPLIAATCRLVEQLVCQSPELAAVVVAAGGVPSLLDVLRKHKAEGALEAALGLLAKLLALEEARSELVAQGGVPLLADVMGPPPRAVLRWQKEQEEQQQQQQQQQGQQQQSPASQKAEAAGKQGKEQGSEQQQKAQDAQRARVKQSARGQQGDTCQQPAAGAPAAGRGGGVNRGTSVSGGAAGAPVVVVDGGSPESRRTAANSPSLPLREPSLSIFSKVQGSSCGANSSPGSPKAEASCASLSTERSLSRVAPNGASSLAAAASASPSPPQPGPDMATNRSGVRWIMLPGLELAGAAAACLGTLTQTPECMEEMDRRCTLQRILPHLAAATTPKPGEGTKKSKKGGLALSTAATAALRPLLALLKFMALTNANRYRIGRYGALPAVVSLYGGTSDFLLRTHCQAILSSVALIAENGQSLQEAKMPEEFLVPNPMRLAPDERQVLRIEFPGEGALD